MILKEIWSRVPLKTAATVAADKQASVHDICFASGFVTLTGGTSWRWEPSCVLGKPVALFQGTLTDEQQTDLSGGVPDPSGTGTSWRYRAFAFQSRAVCFFHFNLGSRRPLIIFFPFSWSLRKEPEAWLN